MTVCFWSAAEHHALAIRPIYNKMRNIGRNVVPLFNQPAKKLLPYNKIVSSTAPDIPPSKRKNTIYHFHSLHPIHANPVEDDYKYMPLFKGVMFSGSWWINKWKKLPKHWAVVGWPKNDLLKKTRSHLGKPYYSPTRKTVLYGSTMHNLDQLKTLKLLIKLSTKMDFTLMVKSSGGRARWYPDLCKAMQKEIRTHNISWHKPQSDIVNLFPYADVLVSESSGSLWEFLATGRPSIQVDINAHRWNRLFPGGVLIAKLNKLEQTLKSALNNPDSHDFSKWRTQLMGEIDGKATDRAIAFIEKVFK